MVPIDTTADPIVRLLTMRASRFWLFQLVGWAGLCLVTYFSLTLWYNSSELKYIVHTMCQALLGVGVSVGLREIYSRLRGQSPVRLAVGVGLSILVASILWTVLRMAAFDVIVREENLWADFGGWFFGSFLVFLCWTSLYFGLNYYRLLVVERAERQAALAAAQAERLLRLEAEALNQDAQLAMLRYQLNPHFLFNCLNSIGALIKLDRGDAARSMLAELGTFLRYSLDTDPHLRWPLKDECRMLKGYLSIEAMRFGDRLRVDMDVEPAAEDALIPNMLLQPLVENALVHGVDGASGEVTVTVRAWINSSAEATNEGSAATLSIAVSDTGVGFDGETPHFGIGLNNIAERLRTTYGDAATLAVSPRAGGGTTGRIDMPYCTDRTKDHPASGDDKRERIQQLEDHHVPAE